MSTKRANITVDQEAWENIQSSLSFLKIPKAVFNQTFNLFIRSQSELLNQLKERRAAGEPVDITTFIQIMTELKKKMDDTQLDLDLK